MTQLVDEKYYQFVGQNSLSERLLIRARDQIYTDFIEHMKPSAASSIVDVGVSDVINDGANVLERKYPYPHMITACGLGEAVEFQRTFRHCSYRRIIAHARLPFDDGAFDIATANAVLEHVGTFEQKRFFIKELCRIAKKIFITVPHRYFPIEHHTSIPILHYSDHAFRLACALFDKSEWCDEVNLVLMTRKILRQLVSDLDRDGTVGYTGLKLGPLSSNLFMSII